MLEKLALTAYRVGTIIVVIAGSAVTLMGAKSCITDMRIEAKEKSERYKREAARVNEEDYD